MRIVIHTTAKKLFKAVINTRSHGLSSSMAFYYRVSINNFYISVGRQDRERVTYLFRDKNDFYKTTSISLVNGRLAEVAKYKSVTVDTILIRTTNNYSYFQQTDYANDGYYLQVDSSKIYYAAYLHNEDGKRHERNEILEHMEVISSPTKEEKLDINLIYGIDL